MVVYHLNVFIGTVLCVPHAITNVTVALMFVILYPRQESNLQLTRLKLVVFTVSPRGYFDGKVGFEPTYSRPTKTERFTIKLLTKHFGKTDGYVNHLQFE